MGFKAILLFCLSLVVVLLISSEVGALPFDLFVHGGEAFGKVSGQGVKEIGAGIKGIDYNPVKPVQGYKPGGGPKPTLPQTLRREAWRGFKKQAKKEIKEALCDNYCKVLNCDNPSRCKAEQIACIAACHQRADALCGRCDCADFSCSPQQCECN